LQEKFPTTEQEAIRANRELIPRFELEQGIWRKVDRLPGDPPCSRRRPSIGPSFSRMQASSTRLRCRRGWTRDIIANIKILKLRRAFARVFCPTPSFEGASVSDEGDLIKSIRSIADYPKPGIMFRDITTLLGDARAFRRAIDELVQPWAGTKIEKIAGIEARGFILGGAIAHQLSAGFVPIRKKGKLPHAKVSIAYSLEYGLDEMEMHEDAVSPGERVLLVDDLIATGGTAEGAVKLLKQLGADIVAACFVIDLPDLGGAAKIRNLGVSVRTLISFAGH
jgi:adenine phosphoribosyltransferase